MVSFANAERLEFNANILKTSNDHKEPKLRCKFVKVSISCSPYSVLKMFFIPIFSQLNLFFNARMYYMNFKIDKM